MLCSNVVKFERWEIGEIMRCLLDQKNKILPGALAVATARIAPKIYQGEPPTMFSVCFRFHPNRFTFGGVIADKQDVEASGVKFCTAVHRRLKQGITIL